MLWLKFIHIAGIAIWVAGLLYLSALLASHDKVRDQQEFARIRMASRFAYMGLISPAAFLAIAAGTALLFVADALHPWMFVKLAGVAVLIVVHVQYAYVLTNLAEEGARGPTVRIRIMVTATILAAISIVALALSKPPIAGDFLPDWLSEPGFLKRPADPAPALSRLPLPARQ